MVLLTSSSVVNSAMSAAARASKPARGLQTRLSLSGPLAQSGKAAKTVGENRAAASTVLRESDAMAAYATPPSEGFLAVPLLHLNPYSP